MKKGEVGRMYDVFGSEENCIQAFGRETWTDIHFEDIGLDGKIILKRTSDES